MIPSLILYSGPPLHRCHTQNQFKGRLHSVSIIFQNMDDLMLLEAKFVEINQVEIIFDENLEASLDRPELRPQAPQKKKDQYFKEQERAQRSFYKFLLYFIEEQVCYPQLVREDLKKAKELICQKFIGCSKFLDKFSKKLDIFSSSIYPSSKGILLFGPPGTGKSAITNAFCEASGFRYVCTPLAAGELKKGIYNLILLFNISYTIKLIFFLLLLTSLIGYKMSEIRLVQVPGQGHIFSRSLWLGEEESSAVHYAVASAPPQSEVLAKHSLCLTSLAHCRQLPMAFTSQYVPFAFVNLPCPCGPSASPRRKHSLLKVSLLA